MIGFASWFKVEVGVVARGSGGLRRIALMFFAQRGEAIKHLLGDQVALFHPSFGSRGRAHLHETFLAIEHFDRIAILDGGSLVVHGGHPIAQKSLRRGDVHDFVGASPAASASGRERQGQQNYPDMIAGPWSKIFHRVLVTL